MAAFARRRVLAVTLLAVAPATLASAEPLQPTKARCIEANTRAQALRRAGDLSGAREALTVCSQPRCPRIVRDDCASRRDELERVQPTIVFDAKDPDGVDLSAVDVTVDGRPWTAKLDGTALPVDPGEHTFTFELAGQPPVTRKLVLREGEKGRHEEVVIGTPKPSPPPRAVAAPAPASGPSPHGSPTPVGRPIGLALIGVGAAGVVAGGVFGLLTKGAVDQQSQDCPSAPSCTPAGHANAVSDHDNAVRDGLFSEIGFIAGGVLVAGGAALFLLSKPATSSEQSTSGLVVLPSAGPSGGGISLQGRF
jgi:hypothetical protein